MPTRSVVDSRGGSLEISAIRLKIIPAGAEGPATLSRRVAAERADPLWTSRPWSLYTWT
ncbi:hypothetical protein [Candidatus Laterigemmans baculatus]|uniref:hypothetical protein n=1 Tax=Candidatus Laterigemmans baculatus TaxID=2770505 RepID=UPI0013DB004D|nr:hypothetical protein [Candidatus Laterigemmans baculatus]